MTISGVAQAAYSDRTVSIGHSWDLGEINPGQTVNVPAPDDQGIIVGIGIAGSNDHVYIWYADGTVSSGTSRNFEYYHGKQNFVLPEGKNPWDIVAMAIAGSNDHVYTWYADGTVSEGWSQDLGRYNNPQTNLPRFDDELPPGKVVSDIVGIAIAGSNDHVYAWYADGTVSEGWSQDFDYYQAPYSYVLPGAKKIGHIIDIGIAGSNDRVYTWFHDVESGPSYGSIADQVDARAMDILRRYRLPGLGVAVSKNGRVVLEKGYGFRNFSTGSRMQDSSRCHIGSVSKVITALSAMHLDQESLNFSVDQPVYGPQGALSAPIYLSAQEQGVSRHQPIVAKAIASTDHVYTWYHNWTVSSGTSQDPDAYTGPTSYSLPPGMTPEDIRAIAIAPNDRVWVWYDDGTYSAGNSWDLNNIVERDPDEKVSLPPNYNISPSASPESNYAMSHIVGIAIAPDSRVYVWYDNGRQSAGTSTDFDADIAPRSYSTAPGKTRYSIRGIGIAKSNSHVYTWYSDNTVTEGRSQYLGYYGGPVAYTEPGAATDSTKDWHDWYADLKVDHLLSHSSGFSHSGDVPAAAAMLSTFPDALNYQHVHEYILRTRKMGFAPGTAESYSNHGMGLVGHIVAVNSGLTFHDYARANIIDSLGLNIRAASEGQSAADTYRHKYVAGVPSAYTDDPTNDLGLAAGGWKSSAGELVRLMLATDRNPNHPDILSEQTLDFMESRPYPGISSYAHGWDRNSSGKLAHSGRLGGGTTYIAKYPEDYSGIGNDSDPITVAVCTNISISDARGASSSLRKLADDIAVATDRATIDLGYDLY
jgi:CubicO group peptidase (beta-lactamase class C family)